MNTLLSVYGAGSIALAVLFLLCFALVHLARLVRFGWNAQKKPKAQPPQIEPKKEPPPEKATAPEPVYYIVERKKRTKSNYSEPKQIRFK